MDPLTHAVAGLALAWTEQGVLQLAPGSTELQAVYWASLLGSQIPDADIVLRLTGPVNYLKYHRVITHGLISIPAQALLITVVLVLVYSSKLFWLIFCTATLSILLHLFLDLLTVYGTLIYWPFKRRAFALDLLLILDPVLIIVPIAARLLTVFGYVNGNLAAWSAGGLISVYLLARLVIHEMILRCLERFYCPSQKIAVLPNYFSLLRWKFVVKTEERYLLGNIAYPGCKITRIKQEQDSKDFSKEYFNVAITALSAKVFLEFAKFPLLRYRRFSNGHLFQWTDLRYHFKGHEFFKATVFVSNNGKVIDDNLGNAGAGTGEENNS